MKLHIPQMWNERCGMKLLNVKLMVYIRVTMSLGTANHMAGVEAKEVQCPAETEQAPCWSVPAGSPPRWGCRRVKGYLANDTENLCHVVQLNDGLGKCFRWACAKETARVSEKRILSYVQKRCVDRVHRGAPRTPVGSTRGLSTAECRSLTWWISAVAVVLSEIPTSQKEVLEEAAGDWS